MRARILSFTGSANDERAVSRNKTRLERDFIKLLYGTGRITFALNLLYELNL
jgi:hypothetical protein